MFKPIYTSKYRDANFPHTLPSDKAKGFTSEIACSNDYLYIPYSESPMTYLGNTVAVFDWNCQPIKLLSFEDRVQYMYVLPGDKAGFALAEREDGTVYLARFEL